LHRENLLPFGGLRRLTTQELCTSRFYTTKRLLEIVDWQFARLISTATNPTMMQKRCIDIARHPGESPKAIIVELERILKITHKLTIDDIDWEAAARAGLTEDEKFVLTYFSDIESQTIMYMRDLLHTSAVDDPDVIGFLSVWNYEEYFHGYALAKLLKVCGVDLEDERIASLKRKSTFMNKVESLASKLISKIYDQKFITMYMTWGAIQEFTTHAGYQRLRETTNNPVLAELTKRIMKQERVHFAWYYNSAMKRLTENPDHQKFTRKMLERYWSPVGAGIKTNDEVKRLFTTLFGNENADSLVDAVDGKLAALPGMEGISIVYDWFDSNIHDSVVQLRKVV
jgi:rubrerythrin